MNSINQNNTGSQLRPIWPGLIVALLVAVSLSGIVDHDLWTPDEPREAAIALSMSQSGNYVVPELAGKPFVEKPPLFYIIASFFLRVFGQFIGNTAALRLVAAGCGLGTLLFTYLLGRIYFDRQKALIATGILATMIGFVHITHWLLVDNALMFFITASVWALARAYECERPGYLPLAGILAAGAFLTKGLIGPVIIFFAWLGIFIPWVNKIGRRGRDAATLPSSESENSIGRAWASGPAAPFKSLYAIIGYHTLGLIIAILLSSAWIIAFALQGSPELFREWWWTNHFGRFSGQAIHLGHISPWYYYFPILPIYILPWLVPFIIALAALLKKLFRAEPVPAGGILLIAWLAGAFALLSLSATKREIYLSVLLPACALLCLYGPEKNRVLSRVTKPFLERFLVALAMCYATLLIIICPLVDKHKSYGPAFRAATEAVRTHPELKIAGWNLDETTIAGFYYYCGLVFPVISDQQMLADVLHGQNTCFNGVITLTKNASSNDLPDGKNQVIFESRMGKRRLLQLLAAPDWEK